MSHTFIHTADWQIGKAFGGFDPRLGGRLDEARLDVIDTIAEVAASHGAGHVLVAGDVFDAHDLSGRTLRQPLTHMGSHQRLTWVLLPGNHDPAPPGGIWDRIRRIGPPANIVIADRAAPIELAPGLIVLPAPLTAKAMASDPTAWMDGAGRFDGVVRVGLAHGSVRGFGSEGESAVPIDPARVASARLDYLALGDWHGMKCIGPRAWYSGTPEPDNFTKNTKGYVLVVRIAAPGAEPLVTEVATGRYAWARVDTRLDGLAELAAVDRTIAALTGEQKRLLLSLTLSGSLTLADHAALADWREELDARVAHLVWNDAELALTPGLDEPAIRTLLASAGDLAFVAERLDALAAADETGAAVPPAVARTALLRLVRLAQKAVEDTA